ncbi:MAG: hypothetical protein RL367_2001 [Pseudomonadota bacterium]|jgi:aspartyl protease family protein
MSDVDQPRAFYYVLWLVLLVASLGARRLPIKDTLRMALGWVAIFSAVFVLFTFRGQFQALWRHVKLDVAGSSTSADGTERIKLAEDGHFHANVLINRQAFTMLVDTGATITTLSNATARKASVDTTGSAFPVVIDTANGSTMMQRATVAQFTVGAIKRDDFGVLINDHDDQDVVGMNFLSTLKSWRVEGDELILVP